MKVIYVKDANGWDQGCESSEDVFFGSANPYNYIHSADGGHPEAGHILVPDSEAEKVIAELEKGGDWEVWETDEDGKSVLKSRRPEYAIANPEDME